MTKISTPRAPAPAAAKARAAGAAIAAIAAAAVSASAWAQADAPCAFPYEKFEIAVPHVDMAACPASMSGPEPRFCRAAAGGDFLHVYAFAEDGAQCLLQVESFDEDAFTLSVK